MKFLLFSSGVGLGFALAGFFGAFFMAIALAICLGDTK